MKHRRAVPGLVVAALLALAASPAHADRGGYSIARFHAEITVDRDASIDVEERIEVDFSEPRHGIYRAIPVRYTDPRGYGYSLGLRFSEVVDETGRRYGTKVTNEKRYVKIRIGSPSATVTGRKVYIVRYHVERALVHFPEHDELYWNVTGTEWNAPIGEATATVRLPGPPEEGSVDTAGWAGGYGAREPNVRIGRVSPGVVSYAAPGPLRPMEGLTVALSWPPGLVDFPGPLTRIGRFLADNLILVAPILIFVFLWRTYLRKGRDPDAEGSTVMVRYEPPPDVTPGEIGTLVDERADLRDITATVVDLAVRGYLVLRVEKEDHLFGLIKTDAIVFEKTAGKAAGDLKTHEREVLQGIFADGDRVALDDLKNVFYKRIPAIKSALYQKLVDDGYFDARPGKVRSFYMLMGVLAGGATTVAGIAWAVFRGGILPPAAIPAIVAGTLSFLLFVAFAPAMPRRTKKGVNTRGWALGFEEFVDRVEGERINADDARQVFERLLPYAMALGIAAAWARKFEGIYQARSGPAWFVGGQTHFSTGSFERSITSAMTQAGSAMTSSPRSSGSSGFGGGGGFSGGGGGGGGGGSW